MVKASEITATLRCKVALCGDAAVGKSALLQMYMTKGQMYPKNYKMTSSVEMTVVPVLIPDTTVMVELYVMDTAGHDVYSDVVPMLWNGVYDAIVCYDVSSAQSFDNVRKWIEMLKSSRPDQSRPLRGCIVGCKGDLPVQRHAVHQSLAEDFATSMAMDFFEVGSVPPGKNYESPFMAIAKGFHKAYEEKLTTFTEICRGY